MYVNLLLLNKVLTIFCCCLFHFITKLKVTLNLSCWECGDVLCLVIRSLHAFRAVIESYYNCAH